MDLQEKSLRIGAAALLCALILRLVSSGAANGLLEEWITPERMSMALYLQTGQILRLEAPKAETQAPTQATVPPPTQPPVALPAFAPEDVQLVPVNNVAGLTVDMQSLLQRSLDWELADGSPRVLIVHTHGSESYTKTEEYTESSDYRTQDIGYNVVSIGTEVARVLEAGGVSVIHDTTLHDVPSFSGAYNHSRAAVEAYLAQYPSICVVLDLHRDAVEYADGTQFGTTVDTALGTAAQVMLVVGTDVNLEHPGWPENMALAVKLHAQLEKATPGLCRSISFRKQRFNQDLSPGALLIEMGAAGNTRQEALVSARLLAQGILELAHGTAENGGGEGIVKSE